MEGYKAFDEHLMCKGFEYEIGKIYELPKGQKPKICKRGFHFCKNLIDVFAYYPMVKVRIAKVEALGDIQHEGTKYCTDIIKIIKEIPYEEIKSILIDDNYNTGDCNTGKLNSGYFNSGDHNSGNKNTGRKNSGDGNTGSNNTGYKNTGDYNTGHHNSGCLNSGDFNTGYKNSGNYNTGDHNFGSFNSGNYNTGNDNSGNYNTGDGNSGSFNSGNLNPGIFNTNEPNMRSFNKECNFTFSVFLDSIDYDWFPFMRRICTKNLGPRDYDRIKALPNFDPDIFKEITGIDINEE